MDRTRCLRPGQCLLTRSGGCCCGEERFNTVSATILNANQKKTPYKALKRAELSVLATSESPPQADGREKRNGAKAASGDLLAPQPGAGRALRAGTPNPCPQGYGQTCCGAGAEAERDHELTPSTSPPPPPPNHCTDTHKELAEHFFKRGQSRCGGGPDGSAFGFCPLLHLNICQQQDGALPPRGDRKAKAEARKGAAKEKQELGAHPWSRQALPPPLRPRCEGCPFPNQAESSEDETNPNSFHSSIATVAGGQLPGKTSCAGPSPAPVFSPASARARAPGAGMRIPQPPTRGERGPKTRTAPGCCPGGVWDQRVWDQRAQLAAPQPAPTAQLPLSALAFRADPTLHLAAWWLCKQDLPGHPDLGQSLILLCKNSLGPGPPAAPHAARDGVKCSPGARHQAAVGP
ncbi:hypothetical protein Anapl_03481 [Anas platyrhynchos]|uniref:Uncharacterized protein n=1 Tax=Anas platyrhynchos TaxID=8839 RepID=R0LF38_ANAPL|nr:hypothetical protein Anapl_03481 [Anas platyrhynchos]